MNILKALNLGLAFFLEIFMLVAFARGGWSLKTSMLWRILIAIVVPLIIVVLWGMFFAPKSANRLPMPWLQLAIIVLYGIAALVLSKAGHTKEAVTFVTLGAVNLGLAIIWKQ